MSSSRAKRSRDHDESIPEQTRKRAVPSKFCRVSVAAPPSPVPTFSDLPTCAPRHDSFDALSLGFSMSNYADRRPRGGERAAGSEAALRRLLSLLLLRDSFGGGTAAATGAPAGGAPRISDEIARACQVVAMAHRRSRDMLATSFPKAGPAFLDLFANVLEAALAQARERCNLYPPVVPSAAAPATELGPADACLQSVTKTLCCYARIKSATPLMARHRVLPLMIALLRPSSAASREGTTWS